MEFWKTLLDPREHRKIKGFMLATILVCFGIIDASTWAVALGLFVAGNEYDKYLEKKVKHG